MLHALGSQNTNPVLPVLSPLQTTWKAKAVDFWHYRLVTFRLLHEVDDATFDVNSFAIVAGNFVAEGRVDGLDSQSGKIARFAVRLTISGATNFVVDDEAGTQALILEEVDVTSSLVTLRGVIPCVVQVTTRVRSAVILDVADEPYEIRRRGKWLGVDSTT